MNGDLLSSLKTMKDCNKWYDGASEQERIDLLLCVQRAVDFKSETKRELPNLVEKGKFVKLHLPMPLDLMKVKDKDGNHYKCDTCKMTLPSEHFSNEIWFLSVTRKTSRRINIEVDCRVCYSRKNSHLWVQTTNKYRSEPVVCPKCKRSLHGIYNFRIKEWHSVYDCGWCDECRVKLWTKDVDPTDGKLLNEVIKVMKDREDDRYTFAAKNRLYCCKRCNTYKTFGFFSKQAIANYDAKYKTWCAECWGRIQRHNTTCEILERKERDRERDKLRQRSYALMLMASELKRGGVEIKKEDYDKMFPDYMIEQKINEVKSYRIYRNWLKEQKSK